MKAKKLQLVLPRSLHAMFRPPQQDWLMDLSGFLEVVKARQDA